MLSRLSYELERFQRSCFRDNIPTYITQRNGIHYIWNRDKKIIAKAKSKEELNILLQRYMDIFPDVCFRQ